MKIAQTVRFNDTRSYTNKQQQKRSFKISNTQNCNKIYQLFPLANSISRNWVETLAPNFGNVSKLCI
jgi:hypothetical protein